MRKKTKLIIPGIIFLLLAVAVGWHLVSKQRVQAIKVLATAPVHRGSITVQLNSTGIIQPQVGAIVKIGTRATGVVERMLVQVGDEVKKGVLIAKIDDREQRANYVIREAALRQAQAQLKNVNEVFPLQINQAEQTLEGSIAQRHYNYLTWQRNAALVATGVLAQAELDDSYQTYVTSVTEARSNKDALDIVKANYATQLINAVEGVVSAQGELEDANIQISYTQIHSPLTGIVSEVTAQEGETVVAGLQVAPLITVLNTARMEMLIYVDETDVGTVARGMPVNYTVDAYPGVIFRGIVALIYPEAVVQDNIVYYQALVPVSTATASQLRPEMTTQCSIITSERDGILVVPNNAIKWVDGKQYVFVVDKNSKVTPTQPTFGTTGTNNTEILAGLKEGDTVATRLILPATLTSDDM
ncbi:MAG: efflux RND transporter periplasmic adaptor subunit [Desulfovibrionales bacterium]|nr:efflux RND transporter periplasmic adaptor subunit [Desulfovibrionales bacterium]